MEYMELEEVLEILERIIARTEDAREIQALQWARRDVHEKPNTRTIREVQSIVDAVRAGIPVQIDYYDPERDVDEYAHTPLY